MYSVLLACATGAIKTHIMYECNLNSRQVHQYLEFLLARGMIGRDQVSYPNKWTYKTTENGWKYINAYRVISEIFNIETAALGA